MMRTVCAAVCGVLVVAGAGLPELSAESPTVQVYKTPTCGCCAKWVDHLRAHGFAVEATDLPDVSGIRAEHKVPWNLASCHTAVVDGYVVEGHIPAADVRKLLEERPPVIGIAVPGMPIGSPGMEGPNPEAYNVFAFDADGRVDVFSSHHP